jgi:hypothetical protein
MARCPIADTFYLPAVYEKTCDQTNANCQLLTTPTQNFLSVPAGTQSGYAVFDTSTLPAGRTAIDALLVLYSGAPGTFAGSYIGAPVSSPTVSLNTNPGFDPNLSLGRFYVGGGILSTSYFGLPDGANANIWVRAGQEHSGQTTTLLNIVNGWITGSVPNYGFTFILDIGQATNSKGTPPMRLAVCLNP